MSPEAKLQEAKRLIQSRVKNFPEVVIVLGSGLSGLVDEITSKEVEIPYSEIPHLAQPSVSGHVARMVIGSLGGTRVACLQGRLHFYEGFTMEEVVFPFRVLGQCGAHLFFLSNAAGGMSPGMKPGDLVLIKDHINLMGSNPLMGKNLESLGPRFPDMTEVYDLALRQKILESAKRLKIPLTEGVYVALHGPSYETPAEIRMCQKLGGDLVGMSTVPEAIALRHMGKRVVAISCVTNLAAGLGATPLHHSEVIETGKRAQSAFCRLITASLGEIK